MRNVVFVAPFLLEATLRFARAIAALPETRVLGIVQEKPGGPAPEERAGFAEVVEIKDCFSADQIEAAARGLEARHGRLHRIAAILELIQEAVAEARERLGLKGLSRLTAHRFLDKNAMKGRLRELGLPCAKHALAESVDAGLAFARATGYPLVVKPPVGAGCVSTFLISSEDELRGFLANANPAPGRAVQIEEFLKGDEFSFDTITIDGKVLFQSINSYRPTPLDAMRNAWIQWSYVLPRDISGPEFAEAHRVGVAAAEGLGMVSGVTHMEWFRRPDGSVAIGEVAARPPGAHISRATGLIHGTDFHRAWARAVVDDAFDGPWERASSAGAVFFRGPGSGRVVRLEGVEEANARYGRLVVDAKLPQIGAPKSESYEGDGFALVHAPTTAEVEEAIRGMQQLIRVHYA